MLFEILKLFALRVYKAKFVFNLKEALFAFPPVLIVCTKVKPASVDPTNLRLIFALVIEPVNAGYFFIV